MRMNCRGSCERLREGGVGIAGRRWAEVAGLGGAEQRHTEPGGALDYGACSSRVERSRVESELVRAQQQGRDDPVGAEPSAAQRRESEQGQAERIRPRSCAEARAADKRRAEWAASECPPRCAPVCAAQLLRPRSRAQAHSDRSVAPCSTAFQHGSYLRDHPTAWEGYGEDEHGPCAQMTCTTREG